MRQTLKYGFCVLLSLISLTKMHSQDLPSLPKAAEISVGKFPNGAPYYIVKSPSSKGFADFALVRKGEPAEENNRDALVSLPHFLNRKPYDFLAENGIGYGPEGFISLRDDATIYRFANVPIYKKEVQDSTLLLIFDVMAQSRNPQAVVISGDVDVAKIHERAELFSMIVPPLDSDTAVKLEEWKPRDEIRTAILTNDSKNVAVIELFYNAQRVNRKNLSTLLALVTRKYSIELGEILSSRISKAFRAAGIPLADVKFNYKDSSKDSRNERYSLRVYVPADQLDASLALLGKTLGTFDKSGAQLYEFRLAQEYASAPVASVPDPLKNARYLDKCISSYLYGSTLASAETINNFNAASSLEGERELELFNSFARALIDSTRNLSISIQVPAVYFYQGVKTDAFAAGWAQSATDTSAVLPEITFTEPSAKTKLRSEAKEAISGGTLFTFANGVKVAAKQAATKGKIHYELMLNGGSALIDGIKRGESVFAGDMLEICDVAGVGARDFRDALLLKGISLKTEVSPTNITLSGDAPSDKIQDVVSALLTFTGNRTVNRDEYEYYRKCESLREDMLALSPRNVKALMDSTFCPNYLYSELRNVTNLGDDFPERAEKFFAGQFAKADDGILILIGDLDPENLKKELPKMMGDFPAQKIKTPRPNADFQMMAGKAATITNSTTGIVGGAEISSNVGIAALVPYNMETYMSFRIACDVLRSRLVAAMSDLGSYVVIDGEEETFPRERLKLYIQCRPCRETGVPADISVAEQLEVMTRLRRVVNEMAMTKVGKDELKAYKARLSSFLEADLKSPKTLASMIGVRYSESKDMVTSARSAIEAVSAESVSKVLSALAAGSQVEYVIQ